MWIMGLRAPYARALKIVEGINFTETVRLSLTILILSSFHFPPTSLFPSKNYKAIDN